MATTTNYDWETPDDSDLVKDGAAPEARLEERRTLAEVAKQSILEAEARLADRRIVAPFDGSLPMMQTSMSATARASRAVFSTWLGRARFR